MFANIKTSTTFAIVITQTEHKHSTSDIQKKFIDIAGLTNITLTCGCRLLHRNVV